MINTPNNVVENKMHIFPNMEQSVLNYTQTAIEKGKQPTPDATQNLVNEVMNNQQKSQ
ncbi:hypothetical protein ACQYAD_08745 [Neobacillus sp. SM06]|uniref:hypothetical protein n=1 Tax=Neobacillus sp. SM06 TaxID=3422492 RepID=UPI003D279373